MSSESEVRPEVTVVLPTLNEEEGIGACIDRIVDSLDALGVTGEIIVSDSSDDRTAEIARSKGAIVVEPDRRGYGYAYRYAFRQARGDYVVIGDADMTYDFGELPKLYDIVRRDGVDMVIGSRLEGEIKPGAMPTLHRYVGNPLLTKFLNTFYDAGVSDAHSGFRIITRDALDRLDLSTYGMEFASEMIMEAGAKELTIAECPITYHERRGEATLDTFRDGWRHVKFMLVNAPGYVFWVPALVLAGLGGFLLLSSSLGAVVGSAAFGLDAPIVGGFLFVLGYQIGSLAVFSTVAGSPIRKPSDPVTGWVEENFRLEHGIALGLGQLAIGGIVAGLNVASVFGPTVAAANTVSATVTAFVLAIVGVQTVFASLFVSAVSEYSTVTTVDPETDQDIDRQVRQPSQ